MSGRRRADSAAGAVSQNGDEALPPGGQYQVKVTFRFLLLTFSSTILLAFTVGRAARIILLEGPRRALMLDHEDSPLWDRPDYHEGYKARHAKILPPPLIPKGRSVPKTVYTAKNFDTARTVTSSSLLVQRNEGDCQKKGTCPAKVVDRTALYDDDDDDEEEHLPAGQHLLVDMEYLDSSFLDSEERLARAMVEVVSEANLTLLSYHCHSMVPSGVSCVGVLLESHVSFHTWPSEGVITLDLFTCGSSPLVPVVPIIERLFGVPRPEGPPPHTIWSHKLRGFRPPNDNVLGTWDLAKLILGDLAIDYKKEIASVQTAFQRIDIYDIINPRFNSLKNYMRSLSNDGSYDSRHRELYMPERFVMLDGVLQSRFSGEVAYHEALVHPAMFSHPDPKRVAIIGGGEGATLREVLKHNTVKDAIMIEIDEIMVNTSRHYIPSWSDCSDLIGSSDWCGEDPRAQIYYQDALKWFMGRFPESGEATAEPLDVIIMDALDPQDKVVFADALYSNGKFLHSLYDALSEDGILLIQVGRTPGDNPDLMTDHKNRAVLTNHLEMIGFESIQIYGESHSLFGEEWNYLLASKSQLARRTFFKNPAELDLAIHQRIIRTKSGKLPLRYFDGATMMYYRYPSIPYQDVFCRQTPAPEECSYLRGFDPSSPNADLSNFEVRASGAGEKAGRGVFAVKDIPVGSYLALESSTYSVDFPPGTYKVITDMTTVKEAEEDMETLFYYMDGYGFTSSHMGGKQVTVDSSIMTFVNHGCNGTYNMGTRSEIDEFTADEDSVPEELGGYSHGDSETVYNPVIDRHIRYFLAGGDRTIREVKAGEELLDNYLDFVGSPHDWKKDVLDLRAQCRGEDVGQVTQYEDAEKEE